MCAYACEYLCICANRHTYKNAYMLEVPKDDAHKAGMKNTTWIWARDLV